MKTKDLLVKSDVERKKFGNLIQRTTEKIRQSPGRIWEDMIGVSSVKEVIVPNARILVIGVHPEAGFIKAVQKTAENGADIIAIERDPEVIRSAKLAILKTTGNVEILEGSFPNCPGDYGGLFDVVLVPNLIHLPGKKEAQKMIKAMIKLTKPKGLLVFSAPPFFAENVHDKLKSVPVNAIEKENREMLGRTIFCIRIPKTDSDIPQTR